MAKGISAVKLTCVFLHFALMVGCVQNPMWESHPSVLLGNQDCLPGESLPYQGNWLGGDLGVSARLPDKRVFWLFGDTYVSPFGPRSSRLGIPPTLGNTLGVSRCVNGEFVIDYYSRTAEDGTPLAVFAPYVHPMALWPSEVLVHDGELFLVSLKVKYTLSKGLGFELKGTVVARISETSGVDPLSWSVSYFDLTSDGVGDNAYPAASAVVDGSYVYIFAFLSGPGFPNNSIILTRSSLDSFLAESPSLEYYSQSDTWVSGLNVHDAKILVANGSSKFTVRFHPARAEWIATYMLPFVSNKIFMRTASQIEGPWSAESEIYTVPEVTPGSPQYNDSLFCYGGEHHHEYTAGNSILLSYTCNSLNVKLIRTNMSLYNPVFVSVPLN